MKDITLILFVLFGTGSFHGGGDWRMHESFFGWRTWRKKDMPMNGAFFFMNIYVLMFVVNLQCTNTNIMIMFRL